MVIVVVVVVTSEFTSSTESEISHEDMLLWLAETTSFLATQIHFLEHFVCVPF